VKRKPKAVDPGPALNTPDEELELLALMTPADVEEAKADGNMTRLGALLLLAGLAGALYEWQPDRGLNGRYRNLRTGRIVPPLTVRRELDSYLAAHDRTARALAEQLRGGNLSMAQWELMMRRNIRHIHLNAVALQRGGWAQMRMDDFQLAGRIVREQFDYLKRFALQLADGTQRMDGTLVWRAELYSEMARNSYYQSMHANVGAKVTHCRSVRTKRDSCWQCLDLHMRVFSINDSSFPLPGRRVCLSRCGCYVEYLTLAGDGYQVLELA
jgi:hypothetical protein